MYDVAAGLDPDSYLELATVTYREMVAAGFTSVGEFHYLHHQPDGTPYDEPNAMGHALIEAATQAGLRITMLDTCYLSSGFGEPPQGVQVRYDDGSATAWAARVDGLRPGETVRIGAAIHSIRAVPRDQLGGVVRRPRAGPSTCISRSRWGRTTPASGRTAHRPPGCSRTRACSVRAPAPCTPRI